jgi:hypothetical protein
MTSEHIISTKTSDTIVAFYTTVAFVIPSVALLTSMSVMWREEHLWNFSVLQRGHFSSLVTSKDFLYHKFRLWLKEGAHVEQVMLR